MLATGAYGRPYDSFQYLAMPLTQKPFTVIVVERAHASPLVLTYRSREEAMRSANGLRATLSPKEGGQITVQDPDGKELQTWVEHPMGAHFTQQGGFHT
jgi:hypothetical protein